MVVSVTRSLFFGLTKSYIAQLSVGRHAPAGSPISPNQEEQVNTPPAATSSSAPAENTEAEPVFTPSTLTPAATNSTIRFPIRIQTPASVISNTSFTIGIESVGVITGFRIAFFAVCLHHIAAVVPA